MRVRILLFCVVAILCVASASTPTHQPPAPPADKTDDPLRAKVRELEDRITRLERNAAPLGEGDAIPFGELTTNLSEERLQRYVRCKIALKADAADRRAVADAVTKYRAELRNWAIAFLADQAVKDVAGARNHERIRTAMRDAFGRIAFPNRKAAENPIREVLFEEYVIQ